MNKVELQLINVYKEMANHTRLECGHNQPEGTKSNCTVKFGCCAPRYCEMAMIWAREQWQTDLTITDDYKEARTPLKFMELGKGCIIAPHLRPTCTMYCCTIGSLGLKPMNSGPNAIPWNIKYIKLKEQIKELELARYEENRS